MISKHIKAYYPLYILLVIDLVLFAPILFRDHLYYYRDFSYIFYGDKWLYSDTLHKGQMLLWNPYRFCGIPFFANISTGCLNILNILWLIFSFDLSIKLFLFCYFYLSGIGCYWFLRQWKIHKSSALIGSICFVLSGNFLSTLSSPIFFSSYAFIPLVFAVFHYAVRKQSWQSLLGVAIVSSLQLFCGEAFSFVVTHLLLFPYFFIAQAQEQQRFSWQKTFSTFFLLIAFMLLLGAMQILPTWEILQNSTRQQGIEYKNASAWSLRPVESLQIFAPFLEGNSTDKWFGWPGELQINHKKVNPPANTPFFPSLFVGTIGLFLFFIGLFLPGTRLKYFFFAVMTFFFLVALGFHLPFFYLLWKYIPFLDKFRFPIKYMIFFTFSFSIVIAANHSLLLENWEEIWKKYSIRMQTALFLGFICYDLALFLILLPPQVRNLIPNNQNLNNPFNMPVTFAPNASYTLCLYGVLFIICIVLWFSLIRLSNKSILTSVIITATSIQMIVHAWTMNPTWPQQKFLDQGWLKQYFSHLGNLRYYTPEPNFKSRKSPASLAQDTEAVWFAGFGTRSSIWQYAQVTGYGSAKFSRYQTFWRTCFPQKMFYLSSTRYIITNNNKLFINYPLIAKQGDINLYENKEYVPRVWFPQSISFVPSIKLAQQKMSKRVKDIAYIETTSHLGNYSYSTKTTANINDYQPHKVTIEVTTNENRWLIFNDTFDKNWVCTIDGKKTKIYPANILFRAIYVPKGKHTLHFTYQPTLYKIGFCISLFAWGFCLVLFLWYIKTKKYLLF